MNEWSPGGFYSRPVTPKHHVKPFRCQREDVSPDACAVPEARIPETPLRPFELSPAITTVESSKINKKNGAGTSDPRFKRVITSSPCVEDVLLGQKKQATLQEEHVTSLASTNSVVANPNAPAFLPRVKIESSSDRPGSSQSENVESKETQQEPPGAEKICENETAFEAKVIDKVSSHPPIGVPKKSASDCTIPTRAGSQVDDEDVLSKLQSFPSTTRLTKVRNWMRTHKYKPEKRRSVITVIGQTQGRSLLSSTLHDIDQRRRQVKEMDKHALCKAILDTSDRQREIIVKIDFLPPSDKLLCSGERSVRTGYESAKDYAESVGRSPALSSIAQGGFDISDLIPEHDRPGTPSKLKRRGVRIKQVEDNFQDDSQDTTKTVSSGPVLHFRPSHPPLIYLIIVLSGALCWFTFFKFFPVDALFARSKPVAWYEKLLS